jgi:hypothetical protein
MIVAVVIIVIIIALVAIALFESPGKSTTSLSSTIASTTTPVSSTMAQSTSTANTTTIAQGPVQNKTLTESQVISTLGTGWISASQSNYGPSEATLLNGTTEGVQGYGIANFTNGGEFLVTEWVKFQSTSQAAEYANSTFRSSFPTAMNATTGTQGNATYTFYSGSSINKGQAASVIYAHEGTYAVLILNLGTSFPSSVGQQLLAAQLSNLNAS